MKPKLKKIFLCLILAISMLFCCAAFAEETGTETTTDSSALPTQSDPADTLSSETPIVYIGSVETRMGSRWECKTSFMVGSTTSKSYDTMLGNVLRITLYSNIKQDSNTVFYLPQDSHISFLDDAGQAFSLVGQSGSYYCYQTCIRVTEEGEFDLTIVNSNTTLYNGVFDTIHINVQSSIDTLDFLVEEMAEDKNQTTFSVTANGGSTTVITPDTIGFNASDSEWKLVDGSGTEKVLFSGTTYANYTFEPSTISMTVTADPNADSGETVQIYYLGLINGKLITVGPFGYPASLSTYSRSFMLGTDRVDRLATDHRLTVYGYLEEGRTPMISVKDEQGVTSLVSVEQVAGDRNDMDKFAITVEFSDTSNDVDLLIGNRWSANQVAYNYCKLHVGFQQEVESLAVTGTQNGNYNVVYTAVVNGVEDLDTQSVNWYVNDVLQDEHSLILDKTYTEGGRYAVCAELDGTVSNTLYSDIIVTNAETTFWIIATLLVMLLNILLLRYRSLTKGGKLDAYIQKTLLSHRQNADKLYTQLKEGKITPIRAVAILRRSSSILLLAQDRLQLRHRETNLASYKTAANLMGETENQLRQITPAQAADSLFVNGLIDSYRNNMTKALNCLKETAAFTAK